MNRVKKTTESQAKTQNVPLFSRASDGLAIAVVQGICPLHLGGWCASAVPVLTTGPDRAVRVTVPGDSIARRAASLVYAAGSAALNTILGNVSYSSAFLKRPRHNLLR